MRATSDEVVKKIERERCKAFQKVFLISELERVFENQLSWFK